jgi:O-antigen/teichoic acid export membrane protein
MRKYLPDLTLLLLLFLLPLAFFAPVTLGTRTLIPADNLYQWAPYDAYRDVVQAPDVPHNALLSDLVLQNYVWKDFIRDSAAGGELPLWSPYLFGGVPFFAAGQSSALYPLSFLHYVLPLEVAYGWYAVLQLWIAGVCMYLFARGLGLRRIGALVAAVSWQLSAFFLVRTVFPMIQSAASWLPLLLLMIEFVIQSRPLFGRPATLPWAAVGAIALGLVVYAGHIEILYYTLLVMAYYAAFRLLAGWWTQRQEAGAFWRLVRRGVWLVAMVGVGLLLGASQILPLYELVARNFREGSATLDQILGWAYPKRRVLAFLMPNFFGSPAHHSYFDVFTGQTIPATVNTAGESITTIYWGIKNYVEGGAYLGILPMALAIFGLVKAWGRRLLRRDGTASVDSTLEPGRPYRAIFATLGAVSLTFIFGLPTYALLYYLLPGINQLHSPFRWVFPLTLSVAVLAGFGADALARRREADSGRLARGFGWVLTGAGALTLIGLAGSYVLFPQIEPLVTRALESLALANTAFADARMFYSYEFGNVLVLGLALLGSGVTFLLARRAWRLPARLRAIPVWQVVAVIVIVVDLMIATGGFNPAADPALLDFTPPAMAWLQDREAEVGPFRITTLDDPGADTLYPNIPMLFGLEDVRGYDSIIPRQYTEYMALISPQFQLEFNRVAPLTTQQPFALESPLLDLLTVRYVVTEGTIDTPGWEAAYSDAAVTIYENPNVMPRAYTLPASAAQAYSGLDDFAAQVQQIDPRRVVFVERESYAGDLPDADPVPADPEPQTITAQGNIQVMVDVAADDPAWLVLADSHFPGWRAFIRPVGTGEDFEQQIPLALVNGNFRGVYIDPEALTESYADRVDAGEVELAGEWTVRFRYSPQSFQIGAFFSFIAGAVLIFTAGVWLWRTFYTGQDDADSGTMRRVAKNSVTPIVLNLFNKGIDFAFAFIMLRVLGPTGAGIYYYAIVIFGWFDILTNFGLNTFLTREVARNRDAAGRYLFNTSALRVGLIGLSIPLLAGFLFVRQTAIDPALDSTAVIAIVLLYIGVLPASLNTGLSALFYAFEKAEYPAAITTVSTIVNRVLGLGALLLGWGVIGLAGVSIITNFVTLAIMLWTARPMIRRARRDKAAEPVTIERGMMRHMLGESWPLMINHLLATIFYKIDVILMEAINGVNVVGWYSTAYKWLDALQVIPAFLSAALLPVLSRQAQEDPPALVRSYRIAVKLLAIVALPVAGLTTFIAPTLILILGGPEFLPDGAVALQLMVWSIPVGWVNSVTQYVLIALDRQRILTRAFVIAVGFNIGGNLIFLPQYSYRAAAIITIMSEGLLLVLFMRVLAQTLAERIPGHAADRVVSPLRLLWRPGLATGLMIAVVAILWNASGLLAVAAGGIVYPVLLVLLRPFDAAEQAQLAPLLPSRLRSWWSARLGTAVES